MVKFAFDEAKMFITFEIPIAITDQHHSSREEINCNVTGYFQPLDFTIYLPGLLLDQSKE